MSDWGVIAKSTSSFNSYVPLEYHSDYLKRLPTEESVVEYDVPSRKNSVTEKGDPLDFCETLKSERTYVSGNDSLSDL